MVVPERDYAEHTPTYEMPYRGWNDRMALATEQPVQRECYACDEVGRKFFVNDIENPYTTDPDKPFLWIRGRQVGGRSIMWARQCYRLGDLDFEANAREGYGTDWPIRYADLAPWYDHVEAFVGISGRAEGLPQLPDGVFLPPMQMSCVEEHVRDAIAECIRRAAHDDHRAHGRSDRRPQGAERLSLLRSVPPRLPHAQLLQLDQRDAPRGRGYRPHDAAPQQRRPQRNLGPACGPRDRGARDRRRVPRRAGVPCTHCFPRRLGARVRAHPAEFHVA